MTVGGRSATARKSLLHGRLLGIDEWLWQRRSLPSAQEIAGRPQHDIPNWSTVISPGLWGPWRQIGPRQPRRPPRLEPWATPLVFSMRPSTSIAGHMPRYHRGRPPRMERNSGGATAASTDAGARWEPNARRWTTGRRPRRSRAKTLVASLSCCNFAGSSGSRSDQFIWRASRWRPACSRMRTTGRRGSPAARSS